MKSFIAALRSLVLPFGSTSGTRIVLDGVNGLIQVYNSADKLVAEITPGNNVGEQPGFVAYTEFGGTQYMAQLTDASVSFAATGTEPNEPGSLVYQVTADTDPASLALASGHVGDGSSIQGAVIEVISAADLASRPRVWMYGDVDPVELDIDGDADVSGSLTAGNIDSGLANVNTVADQWISQAVNFNKTFSAVPVVTVTGNSNAPAAGGTTRLYYAATAVTTTGFTLRVLRQTAINMDIGWIAIGA